DVHNFGTIDLIVVVVYLIGIGGIGIYQAVKIKSSGDYFTGGRKFSKWLMMMHALGTGTHADDPVVVTGAAYNHGMSGIWYTFVYLFVTPFYWVIAPFFRRSRFITTADFFRARFGTKMALLYSIMGVITFALYTGMMLKATGTLASAVTGGAMPQWVAITSMTVVFVSYGLAGGLIATVITESIQGLLIVVMSLLLIPFGLAKVGGFSGLHQLLSADKFSLHAPTEMTIPWIIAGSVMMLIGIVSQPHIMEVCSTGKTEFEGRVGFTYGNFVKRFCAMGLAFTGVVVLAMVAMPGGIPALGAEREAAFGTAIRVLLPVGFTGLMFAAILAAQMSTLSAFMVASSALLARNIYKEHFNPNATDEQLLSLARWIGLIVVAIGVGFAFKVSGVAQALTINWAVSTLTGIFMWFGVLWRRTNSTGAWISFALMAAIWIGLGPVGSALKPIVQSAPTWLGVFADKKDLQNLGLSFLPAGVIALVVGSLAAARERSRVPALAWTGGVVALWAINVPLQGWAHQSAVVTLAVNNCLIAAVLGLIGGSIFPHTADQTELDKFYLLLKTPVGREEELKKAGVDVVYAGSSEGHPLELKRPVLVNVGGFLVALAFSLVILGILYALTRIGA
ncbi:MAG: sodium:solute symporter family protein, partial [Armatimonadetes bacterium]|nr:sodium:solute symporter family protein [Armatimonadota bacterium]